MPEESLVCCPSPQSGKLIKLRFAAVMSAGHALQSPLGLRPFDCLRAGSTACPARAKGHFGECMAFDCPARSARSAGGLSLCQRVIGGLKQPEGMASTPARACTPCGMSRLLSTRCRLSGPRPSSRELWVDCKVPGRRVTLRWMPYRRAWRRFSPARPSTRAAPLRNGRSSRCPAVPPSARFSQA